MRRPSFQFYPGDWSSNPNLKRCTFAERGIWVEVMCLMHDQDEYGVLRWPLKEIAGAVGCKVSELQSLVRKGVMKGDDGTLDEPFVYVPRSGRKDGDPVTLIDTQDGPIWYSSRMVKDEYVRTIRGGEAIKGDTPKHSPNPPIGAAFGPRGSSSSSSPSDKTKGNQAATTGLDPAAAPHPPDPIQSRALELVAMLRQRGAAIAAGNPHVRRWAEAGVTDAQALSALETAERRRSETGSVQPVNAGLLNAILDDQQRATPQRKNIHDERAETIAALTGRRNHEQHESGNVIDITPTVASGMD